MRARAVESDWRTRASRMYRRAAAMLSEPDIDRRVRLAAFAFLDEARAVHGDVVSWRLLTHGFRFDGERVCLIGQSGIWKPRVLPRMPLSIATAPITPGREPPYADRMDQNGFLEYRYRGTDRNHRDNVALRLAKEARVPLIYMFGVVAGQYMPVYPVYVVGEESARLAFTVAVDERTLGIEEKSGESPQAAEARRSYVTRVTVQRLHQATFRERVLRAYTERCAICSLHHAELLDAAHIVPDKLASGEPVVPNGLALCKLHHAAFDRHILGIRPDRVIEIRRDILEEHDGPMLRHGLQELQDQRLAVLPRQATLQPGQRYLEERYEIFRKAV